MSDNLAVLDKNKALQRVSGNEKLADDLLIMLLKELPGYIQGIKKELESGNKEELRKIIHKMHGGLSYVGAPALKDIVSRTDLELFDLSDEQLEKNITLIYKEINRVLEAGKYNSTTT
ncbi:MAG: Hpt domain-containing protein [gamma proteobacterium symbiont of Bathyaustriella thionipta]|nr:Hpt domain-containing protein [gamma proteobacterium symbiont of Bathyaustriella thionipta]MCU7950584.1 Hpt domain-containing protein [gamma proteobacterium symbiont of Bathyaustriella thionipta]MCU7952494.1 Hpt domain-containing protein [gamma proteobacterium symbiont of Bathyaustriella thionipta]MCU7957092.1 Hpt domain-containing protein [gamma proteobacterium symbiont of Bathyaustriella thionipta]MCU7967043.1 Hpt domain-containing protein [gamma proteobacterium symbiont of Bathyaustriella